MWQRELCDSHKNLKTAVFFEIKLGKWIKGTVKIGKMDKKYSACEVELGATRMRLNFVKCIFFCAIAT